MSACQQHPKTTDKQLMQTRFFFECSLTKLMKHRKSRSSNYSTSSVFSIVIITDTGFVTLLFLYFFYSTCNFKKKPSIMFF